MAESNSNPATLWYVRRGTTVKGPFPASQIAKYVVLGRVHPSDEVSQDQQKWHKVAEFPSLVPPAVKESATSTEQRMLRQREDERSGHDRRHIEESLAEGVEQRRPGRPERRGEEPETVIRHRRQKAALLDTLRSGSEMERRSWRWIAPAAVILVAGLVALGFLLGPATVKDTPDCGAPPAPGVNWNNCTMDGLEARDAELEGARIRNARLRDADLLNANLRAADLAYTDFAKANLSYADLSHADLKGATVTAADLTNADLTGADLSYANLRDARLGGAVITGTLLSGAVWPDGRTCGRDSVGECRVVAPAGE
ncbi:MAG: pentapeptide repeat-containing protein [Gammaproteobacteria bacterium]|nr:pentapeptide repeat-containing protein [Gammaproteobacteria bacterium]